MEEELEDGVFLPHFHHDDRLSLRQAQSGDICIACWKLFRRPEAAYSCSKKDCGYAKLMHQECAEMPRRITHPLHTHELAQKHFGDISLGRGLCAVCARYIHGLGYYCAEGCVFQLHLGCASPYAANKLRIEHPSHQHDLHQLNRLHSFRCDACGTTRNQTNSSYICIICQYWIHDECANLPPKVRTNLHLQHSLSLAFRIPEMFPKFNLRCVVCHNESPNKYWVYICKVCHFVVHMKCLGLSFRTNEEAAEYRGDTIIQFPINDLSQGLVRPFVLRELGHNNSIYQSHHHDKLSLLSDDEDKDEDDHIRRSEVICGVCTTPIHRPKYMSCGELKYFVHFSCSRLSPVLPRHPLHQENHKMILQYSCPEDTSPVSCDICGLATSGLFYACAECDNFRIDVKCASMPGNSKDASHPHYKYHNLTMLVTDKRKYTSCKKFVHLSCSQLPLELPYHPLHQPNHKMILQTCPTDTFVALCDICCLTTSGLFYACAECDSFKIDIKCASMPNTINHASHPQKYHDLKMLVTETYLDKQFQGPCRGCGYVAAAFYRCDSCRFVLCFRCASLPASVQHIWDDHWLSLMYDRVDLNHPDPFYCEVCEEEIDPEQWMYRCDECDQSFHLNCIPTETGEFKNIKFGEQYVFATCHDHPLSYQLITAKLRCDLCRDESVFGRPGFYCELCDFVMCFDNCVIKHKHTFK